jgi:REP element-mobilizing transposase RayT
MNRKYKFHNPEGTYFVSFAVRKWVNVFSKNEYKNIFVENLAFYQLQEGLEIYAWCIMNSHIHLIVSAEKGRVLQNVLRNLKSKTGKEIIRAISGNSEESRKEWLLEQFKTDSGFRFWQKGSHPMELRSQTQMEHMLDFVHQNPVKEGLVFKPEDYKYSSASDYAIGKGLLDIQLIENTIGLGMHW